MPSLNRVILLGHLCADPSVRYTPNGAAVGGFAIAVNRKYKHGEETKEAVHYFDIVTFGKQAETCGEHLNKGDAVIVEGRLQQRRWDDKDTGQKRSKVDIAAQTVTFIGSHKGGAAESQGHE